MVLRAKVAGNYNLKGNYHLPPIGHLYLPRKQDHSLFPPQKQDFPLFPRKDYSLLFPLKKEGSFTVSSEGGSFTVSSEGGFSTVSSREEVFPPLFQNFILTAHLLRDEGRVENIVYILGWHRVTHSYTILFCTSNINCNEYNYVLHTKVLY